ncbi:hypothetical protein AC482_01875 [miscellaneous Crenarchaeota group-15 archaeon DG-45]|uniref:Major facilitator superfamily (MFS) profile domain-containing protein n=1 Tax=miscellaneous Crenarchaeota group-15 archaeon DG-45 TaxID=1685127 RepID=A0A0M0BR80_9ARCH|nr:MAG: hypothetical protein AC482_01875 [miscellaneous Crenarchaeota group-15 archaeon DG-45]
MFKGRLSRPRGFFYGWVIVAVFFLVDVIVYGIRNSFSVFYLSLLDEFGWGRAGTVGIFSLHIVVYGLVAPVSGRLADKFGPRKIVPLGTLLIAAGMVACSMASRIWQFYILFGVIISVGICVSGWSQFAPILSEWFVRRRAAALGIVSAGYGLCFALSSLTEFLISRLGWRGALVALGAIPILTIAPLTVLLVKRRPEEMGLWPDGDPAATGSRGGSGEAGGASGVDSPAVELTLAEAVRTYPFWMIFFANFFFWGIGTNMILAHQVAFVNDIGYSEAFAAFILSLYGVVYAVGNLFGFVSDRFGRGRTFAVGSAGLIAAMLILIAAGEGASPWMLYAYAALFGFCMGVGTPTLNAIQADLFQGRSFGTINGFLMLGFGIGGSLGPWIGGVIYDTRGTYIPAFSIAIFSYVVTCVLVLKAAHARTRAAI